MTRVTVKFYYTMRGRTSKSSTSLSFMASSLDWYSLTRQIQATHPQWDNIEIYDVQF